MEKGYLFNIKKYYYVNNSEELTTLLSTFEEMKNAGYFKDYVNIEIETALGSSVDMGYEVSFEMSVGAVEDSNDMYETMNHILDAMDKLDEMDKEFGI